jgi:crotonobetainyl-CoA:carnitine CoA-transferase CaiB-like acyl-CoA transferase
MPIVDSAAVKSIQGKESLAIDLETEEGRAIIHALARKADLALCSWRAGVARHLKVDDEALRALNPRLVYHYGTSFGLEGPYTRRPAYAPSATAGSGLADYQGGPEVPPPPGTPLSLEDVKRLSARVRSANGLSANGDTIAAVVVGTALLLGLLARRRTGVAQRTLTTMLASNGLAASDDFLRYEGKPPRRLPDPALLGFGPLYRLYETADGSDSGDPSRGGWVFLACPQPKEWAPLAAALNEATAGRLDLAADLRFATPDARAANAAALADTLAETFRGRTAAAWEDFLLARDIACVEVSRRSFIDSLFDSPLLRENGLIRETNHPIFGRQPRTGLTVELSRTPGVLGDGAALGQHTRPILEELGYTPDQVADLAARHVVRLAAAPP